MPGFLGEFNPHKTSRCFTPCRDKKLINDSIDSGRLYLERRTIRKFEKDKCLAETSRGVVLLEGVITNKREIFEKYGVDNADEAVWAMYDRNGSRFMDELRGSFSGVLYDPRSDELIVFTSHIGDKQVFYSQCGESLIFGSEINFLTGFYQNIGKPYSLDELGAYFLLTYGFMLGDVSPISEVKRLGPGQFLRAKNGSYRVETYYELKHEKPPSEDLDELVAETDRLFRQAIERQFEKDKEYSYRHLAALSGGLDSRMTTWVAHSMGYKDIVNFTFSESDHLDETIPKKIARDLRHEWIFKALDNGNFLKAIDEMTTITEGKAFYNGLSHGMSMLKYLNFENFGIVHSGQLGDVVLGTFYNNINGKQVAQIGAGAYSKFLLHRLEENGYTLNFKDQEIYMFNGRAFLGANQGLLGYQNSTESMSPFYDIDLLNFALCLPIKFRLNHTFYFSWMRIKYPNSCNYIWEKTGTKPGAAGFLLKGHKFYYKNAWKKIPNLVLAKCGISHGGTNSRGHMNPYDYWFRTNPTLQQYFDQYFAEHLARLDHLPDLKQDTAELYRSSLAQEKMLALSLLAAVKFYFP